MKFEFRTIKIEEAEQAAMMEQICFPPNEACPYDAMIKSVQKVPMMYIVAVAEDGRLAGLLNGIATDEEEFNDKFFMNGDGHNDRGKNVMLCGLEVLPQYRGFGLSKKLMELYKEKSRNEGRKKLVLTCHDELVGFYESMGFIDDGISASKWGGVIWHEMHYLL